MASTVATFDGERVPIPDYASNCIALLPQFFRNTLLGDEDGPLFRKAVGQVALTGVRNVVFFLVDGFGRRQWRTYAPDLPALQRFEAQGWVGEVDSVFPSSTPVALSTLHTNGLLPAEHGLTEWWLYLREVDRIVATLPFAAMGDDENDSLLKMGADPRILLDNPVTTYQRFEKLGIKTRAFLLREFQDGAYTGVSHKGSELIGHDNPAELFATLADKLRLHQAPSYNYVYWGGIDAIGHRFGPDSPQFARAAAAFFGPLEQFLHEFEGADDTLFVVSADHGQMGADPSGTLYLDGLPGLPALFRVSGEGRPILPWGGARDVFLAIQEGQVGRALDLIQGNMGEDVLLLESKMALDAGLFGKTERLHPELLSRIGDVLVLPKANKTVWYHHPGQGEMGLLGHHGGLSEDELKVPFALLRPSG